jgi:hypothetical protein
MNSFQAGLAFALPTAVGYVVGIATHEVPRIGTLVWISRPTFAAPPDRSDVETISDWRWPTLFPVRAAIRRKLVRELGIVPIPRELIKFPRMRSGGGPIGWVAFEGLGDEERILGRTQDRTLPIYQIVNDTALREMVETDWKPSDQF